MELADEAIRLADLPAASRRTVMVLGHEATGIPPEGLDLLDTAVEIPMLGTGDSLNVAVAGSIVLYKLAGLIEVRDAGRRARRSWRAHRRICAACSSTISRWARGWRESRTASTTARGRWRCRRRYGVPRERWI
ncbi:TrmH family RNA methyltransferase [Micromonospora sp. 4G55]|uniref:TrmH family RNA methyltransferase n=1 Tax=Micromonospora sp. 4G55 TaxID=2806102 RepID=UPI001EE4D8F8|nr:TrmH family RNA methyltransferase [Micromonospora sp. 4G55]